jgi:shikimate dehydrogenase
MRDSDLGPGACTVVSATGMPSGQVVLAVRPSRFDQHPGAFAHCATSSERAKMLNVVSVIRRNPDGTWHDDMLDGLAFVKAQKDHGAEPKRARVLLVGAGSAGSAIEIALLEAGVCELIIHDADGSRVATLIELLSGLGQGRVSAGRPDPTGCDLVSAEEESRGKLQQI